MFSLTQYIKIALLGLACLLLNACHAPPSASEDYLQRLSRVLDVDVPATSRTSGLAYPTQRELRHHNSTTDQISIREFLSLRGCALHTVIAHRNSLIGKVASPSQLLFNDLQILANGPACLDHLKQQQTTNLHKKLSDFLKHKQNKLKANTWQAILGEHENAQFWRRKKQPTHYPDALQQESLHSIQAILDFVQQVEHGKVDFNPAETAQLEQHLQTLSFGDGGSLFYQLQELANRLDKANQMIQQRLNKPLCLNGTATVDARYFHNVVNDFFIAKVQARAVALNRRYQQLMPTYLELENTLADAATSKYQTWRTNRNQQFETARSASKKHVHMIQALFKQCNLQAG